MAVTFFHLRPPFCMTLYLLIDLIQREPLTLSFMGDFTDAFSMGEEALYANPPPHNIDKDIEIDSSLFT